MVGRDILDAVVRIKMGDEMYFCVEQTDGERCWRLGGWRTGEVSPALGRFPMWFFSVPRPCVSYHTGYLSKYSGLKRIGAPYQFLYPQHQLTAAKLLYQLETKPDETDSDSGEDILKRSDSTPTLVFPAKLMGSFMLDFRGAFSFRRHTYPHSLNVQSIRGLSYQS